MKAIICGAGITGISAAWWLEMFGREVVLLESTESLRAQGYMIDFLWTELRGCRANAPDRKARAGRVLSRAGSEPRLRAN